MCGRYCIDDETVRETVRVLCRSNENMSGGLYGDIPCGKGGDVHPTEEAPVICSVNGTLCIRRYHWGFPGYREGQVIFNARSESVLEKPAFRESIWRRRIVIPAACFYEWNRGKEKNTFAGKDTPVLFMAGIGKSFEDKDHFVILTTEANASVNPVHNRMPLLLSEDEIRDFILDDCQTEKLLRKVPELLERRSEYEQLNFL